jgi:hypothetical protein
VAGQRQNPVFYYYLAAQGERASARRLVCRLAGVEQQQQALTVHQTKWTQTRSSRLLFDASSSVFLVDDDSRAAEVQMGDIARFDQVTNTATIALGTYSNNPMFRGVFLGSVSYFTTSHDVKVGYSMNYEADRQRIDLEHAGDLPRGHSGFGQHLQHPGELGDPRSRAGLLHQDKWRPGAS